MNDNLLLLLLVAGGVGAYVYFRRKGCGCGCTEAAAAVDGGPADEDDKDSAHDGYLAEAFGRSVTTIRQAFNGAGTTAIAPCGCKG